MQTPAAAAGLAYKRAGRATPRHSGLCRTSVAAIMFRATLAAVFVLACALHSGQAAVMKMTKQRPSHLPSALPEQKGLVEIEGSNFYFGLNAALNFFEAEIQCEIMNMSLISFQTEEKNKLIMDYLILNPNYDFWMWTSGFRPAATWSWSATGEPYEFTNWGTNEPSNAVGIVDCTDFAGFADSWEDDQCDRWQMSYLCEEKVF